MRGRFTALPSAKSRNAVRIASMQSRIGSRRRTSSSVMMMVIYDGSSQQLPDCNLPSRSVHGHTAALEMRSIGYRSAAGLPTRLPMLAPAGHQGGRQAVRQAGDRAGERESDHGE